MTATSKTGRRSLGAAFVWRFLLGLAVVGGFFATRAIRPPVRAAPAPFDPRRQQIALRGDEPQLGRDDALVTIVEFADFSCEHCSSAADPLRQVIQEAKDVRLVFKHYPRSSSGAALAATAAHENDRFWEMHDFLLAHHGETAGVEDYADELGIDRAAFARSMASEEAKRIVSEDRKAADAASIIGLPSFYVNGRQYSGVFEASEWRQILADEREFAQRVIDRGVAADDLYAHIMATETSRQAPR